MKRRTALRTLAALPLVAAGCSRKETGAMPSPAPMPVVFAAHGAPPLLDDEGWVAELAAWARAMPRPKAVLVVSAHWEARPASLGATTPVPLVYDFYGFPERFYRMTYAAPGAPELAKRIEALFASRGIASTRDAGRGLDHGAYVPLMCMYPEADVPTLQLSLPSLASAELFAMGQALAPLAGEGVLIFGSGFLTHNMRYAFKPGTPAWATEFDAWCAEAIARHDVDALLDFRNKGPNAATALPTVEHFVPLLVAVGAVAERRPAVSFPITGWWMDGAFTRRSVQLG